MGEWFYSGFLAVSSGKGWLDEWRMIAGDDTGWDLLTVAGFLEGLACGGGAA